MFQVGFSSASYFTKSFTREFGVSPKEYIVNMTGTSSRIKEYISNK